jgi:acetoin utilization deacetylase AcuC-like enzyme
MKVFYSPTYTDTSVVWDTTRKATAVAAHLESWNEVELIAPALVTDDELPLIASAAYQAALATGTPEALATSNGIGWDERLYQAVRSSSGGVRDAAVHALTTSQNAGSLSSGLHHARYEHGGGFCTLNGLALSAHAALRAGAARVLILDLDAHCGGGTASLIAGVAGIEQLDVSVDSYDRYAAHPSSKLIITNGSLYLNEIDDALTAVSDPAYPTLARSTL